MTKEKFLITPKTKVGTLLETYPELESILMKISPVFQKLKNPILRKTIGKVATLQQAAALGDVSLENIINPLREAVGQDKFEGDADTGNYFTPEPKWFSANKVTHRFDASPIINRGENPMEEIFSEIKNINKNEIFELTTIFLPAPIIDKLKDRGYKSFSTELDKSTVKTYFLIE